MTVIPMVCVLIPMDPSPAHVNLVTAAMALAVQVENEKKRSILTQINENVFIL